MSNHIIQNKKSDKKTPSNLLAEFIRLGVFFYVAIMFLIYPLYYQNKYYNMGEAKYYFFKRASLSFITILLLLVLVRTLIDWKKIKWQSIWKSSSITDYFVILYAAAVWISFFLTPYKADAIWGYKGWYMGLISQMLFVIIYFLVSRYLKCPKYLLHLICAVSAIVFLLAVLHRFQIDPLHMYEELSMDNKILFLSTIGQATWYSSFLCVVFPVGLYLYWSSRSLTVRIIYGFYVALGFATMVTQNSDSAFIAFLFMLLVLLLASFSSNEKMQSFLEILIIGLASMRFIGILQLVFPEMAVPLEELSIFASQGNFTVILLMIVLLIYIVFKILSWKGKIHIVRYRNIGVIIIGMGITSILLMALCVYLNAKGYLPEWLSGLRQFDYFNFNDNWGNGRGFTWRCAAEIFQEYPLKNKLFGCGPDCFASYAYDRYADTLKAKWGDNVLTNAHNEWFTSLLFFGALGFISYLGIFVTQFRACVKKALQEPFLIAIAMSIAAYFGHNFFCYQQIVCTPLIFILMGIGTYYLRETDSN